MTAPIGPGDWVECIDASTKPWNTPAQLVDLRTLRAGAVYLVDGVGAVGLQSGPTIFLAGLPAPSSEPFGLGWTQSRFRPIFPGGELKRLLLEKPLEVSPTAPAEPELVPVGSELERWGHQ